MNRGGVPAAASSPARRLLLLAPTLPEAAGRSVARAPSLEVLLTRADRQSQPADPAEMLCRHFGIGTRPGADLPLAAICRRGEDDTPDGSGWWLRSDPVHLVVDRDRVFLAGTGVPDLSTEEAETLAAELTPLLKEDGIALETPAPTRWYLRLSDAAAVQTTPPWQVVGRTVDDHLPAGPDAGPWRTRLTELQMLLHASPVNAEREARGLPAVNSLWLWGGGVLPSEVQTEFDGVIGGGCLGRGLASLAGINHRETKDAAFDGEGGWIAAPGEPFEPPIPDPAQWEQDWGAPLLNALGRRDLAAVDIWTGRHLYRIEPRMLRRWWRRPRPLGMILGGAE